MEQKVILWEPKINLPLPKGVKMRIVLCDRDNVFLKKMKNLIYKYAVDYKLDLVVDCFNSGEKLLNSKTRYNIAFLEYHLEGINGFETAKMLRNKSSDVSIVFVSEYTDFVFDAFEVNPYRFLVKPTSPKAIYGILNHFFDKYIKTNCLWIKNRDNTLCLNTSDIYFLEADNKHCYIHLKDEVQSCNQTMAKVYSFLPKRNFSKINRAFVVNLDYVKKYNAKELLLNNEEKLTIGRNFHKSFKEDYRLLKQPIEI